MSRRGPSVVESPKATTPAPRFAALDESQRHEAEEAARAEAAASNARRLMVQPIASDLLHEVEADTAPLAAWIAAAQLDRAQKRRELYCEPAQRGLGVVQSTCHEHLTALRMVRQELAGLVEALAQPLAADRLAAIEARLRALEVERERLVTKISALDRQREQARSAILAPIIALATSDAEWYARSFLRKD